MLERISQLPLPLIEQTFDSLGDVVFCVKDLDGTYQSVNSAFVERVGFADKSDLIGKRAGDLFDGHLAIIFDQQDREVIESARPIQDQLERIAHSDGSMGWFLANKFPILNSTGAVTGLIGISQNLNWPRESEVELANLSRLVAYIGDNLDQPLRTEQLAKQIGLSAIQLDRRMKRVFRLSTKKFIMRCRLDKATRQLESTDMSIAKIAIGCGFNDQSSFTRHFRSVTSETPARFRKQAQLNLLKDEPNE